MGYNIIPHKNGTVVTNEDGKTMRSFKQVVVMEEIYDGKQIAEFFWHLSDAEQAAFFNQLSEYTELPSQMEAVADNDVLTSEGQQAMITIGHYAIRYGRAT